MQALLLSIAADIAAASFALVVAGRQGQARRPSRGREKRCAVWRVRPRRSTNVGLALTAAPKGCR